MSEREETRAEIHHSVLCVAIGKLNVQVGWTSAKEELLDRMPSGLHSVVHDVLDNSGNVSARDMLRAVRIGALRPGNGTLQHKDAVLDQTIAWAFIVVCVVFSLLIGIQIFYDRTTDQALQSLVFCVLLLVSAVVLGSQAIYPHWVAARVARFLEGRNV
jgi:hypothetical protein